MGSNYHIHMILLLYYNILGFYYLSHNPRILLLRIFPIIMRFYYYIILYMIPEIKGLNLKAYYYYEHDKQFKSRFQYNLFTLLSNSNSLKIMVSSFWRLAQLFLIHQSAISASLISEGKSTSFWKNPCITISQECKRFGHQIH